MVNWGKTVDQHAQQAGFLFKKADFVAYENLKSPIDHVRDARKNQGEVTPLLGSKAATGVSGFNDLLDTEVFKVEATAKDRLKSLQLSLSSLVSRARRMKWYLLLIC